MNIPKIGVTLGDPGGIGPEIVIKALSSKTSLPKVSYVLFGSSLLVEEEKLALGLELDIQPFDKSRETIYPSLSLLEVKSPLRTIKKGSPTKENGQASFLFFKKAFEEAKKGTIQALVTAPVSKQSWKLAGLKWHGHTDFLSQAYPQATMAFWSERIKVVLFTHHLPLKDALEKIKNEDLYDFFLRLYQHTEKIQPETFQFLVAGMNPHAGERGLFGSEEEVEIMPAVNRAKKEGMRISGPFPPDVVFRKALNHSDKIVIALYHDQGLIPFKLEAFEKGVNTTLGLPFIRTSPDHGTAFDIANKRVANPESMVEAIKLAYELSPRSL
ncbi:MAG: 4-hydroxythreonine-4-phosphate dehydrogenase PdxA [Candidatus Aminicenantes bacterium]|nr:4-hydroxythreonine-4-phosphate dehydrogenase PdxA [Candidatus Aminicenantes bacterium]